MMGKEKLIVDLVQKIVSGGTIYIHKPIGAIRKNCFYISAVEDIPDFLLEDHAVELAHDGAVILYEPGNRAVRHIPFFLCWKEVSEENYDEVPGAYACWSKDNGLTTLKVVGGKCYNLPPMVQAAIVMDKLPDWVSKSHFPIIRDGEYYVLNRTDYGEKWSGKMFRSLWLNYGGNGDIDILSVHAHSIAEYIVTQNDQDVCKLTELLKFADLLD